MCFLGISATYPFYKGFYGPKIKTPALHVLGELDAVVPLPVTSKLADAFETAEVVEIVQQFLLKSWKVKSGRYEALFDI